MLMVELDTLEIGRAFSARAFRHRIEVQAVPLRKG